MTLDEYKAMTKPSKYRNVKTVIDDITFDSKAEASRYRELQLLLRAGEIAGFKRQPSFLFDCGTRYRLDFIVFGNDGGIWVEDVKGMETQAFKIKQKLWTTEYPLIPLKIIK